MIESEISQVRQDGTGTGLHFWHLGFLIL